MNERFYKYLRYKGVSQKELAKLSGVAASIISRFCNGGVISTDNLQKMLQACDDISLEWMFYGTGQMIRCKETANINLGQNACADFATGNSVMVKNSSGVSIPRPGNAHFMEIIAEKDRVITEKDRTIGQRDATIRDLLERITGTYGNRR